MDELLTELVDLEGAFWKGDDSFFREHMTADALMVFPAPVGVMSAEQSLASVTNTSRWDSVAIHEPQLLRLGADAVLLAYRAEARKATSSAPYEPFAASVYVRSGGAWRLAFHQQS